MKLLSTDQYAGPTRDSAKRAAENLLNRYAGLKAGDVAGFVVQNPLAMGYRGVKTLVAVLRGERVAASVDTGVGFVTRENMNEPAMQELLTPPIAKYLE